MTINHGTRLFTLAVLALLCTLAAARADECSKNDDVQVTLAKSGQPDDKIAEGCFMPRPGADKTLCAHGIGSEHTFSFRIKNDCTMPVQVKLTVKRRLIDFKDADCDFEKNKVLFHGYLAANGGSVTKTCSSRPHTTKGRKQGDYALTATEVAVGGNTVSVDVSLDPEIIIEDNGKHSLLLWAGALLAGALAYALYRFLRRA